MRKLRYLLYFGLIGGFFLLGAWGRPGGVAGQISAQAEESGPATQGDSTSYHRALQTAARAIAQGHFEKARSSFQAHQGEGADDKISAELESILNGHDELIGQFKKARQESYEEHLRKINEAVQAARWREKLLQTSETFSFKSEEKTKEEAQLREKIEERWLEGLLQLSASHNLAERVGVTETVEESLREGIIRKALEVAEKMERQNDWLDAYGKVYYLLTRLDERNEQYEQEGERLLRQALLTDMYVPDPNQDVISWQERRKGVSFEILRQALKLLMDRYVEKPDIRQMQEKALSNCLMLSETPRLSETFAQLGQVEPVGKYREGIKRLVEALEAETEDYYGYKPLLNLLGQVQRINEQTLRLPEEVIIGEFAEGAFSALDGYTYIVWPSDVETFRKEMTNEFSGVGVYIQKKEGLLTIESLLEDAPAAQAGLDAGDVILKIDGKSTAAMSMDMAVRRITGRAGSEVVLTIDRAGFEKPRDYTITRGQIVVRTVKGLYRDQAGDWQYFSDPQAKIAYVCLTNFAEETTASLKKLLVELQGQDMQGLVLDLRNNSGGFLSTAVEVVNIFIDEGMIVSSRSRGATEMLADYASHSETVDASVPMVVLVNSSSASASEIVSGALKDHERALIVGTRTFGKGNVQTIQKLRPWDAEMKMTIAYYYLPKGRRVHHDPKDKTSKDYGVEPDVKVELTGEQLEKWMKVSREASVLHRRDQENKNRRYYKLEEILESDPQLKVGMLCLKGSIVAKSLGAGPEVELVGPVGGE